jgi:antitoxin VapB
MGNEYRAKVFKSGNSVAVRIPKGIGLIEGDDIVIVAHDDGTCSLWREDDAVDVLDNLFGAFSPAFMAGGRGETEQTERDWTAASRDTAA